MENVLTLTPHSRYQQLSNNHLVSVMSAGGHVAPREAVYTPINYRSSREDQPYKSVISPKLNVSRTNSISNNFDVVPASLPALKARSQPPAQVNNVTPNSNSASSSPQYRNKNEDWTYSKGNTVVKGSGGCRLYGSILHNCRQQGALYHDQDFEANDTSIYFSRVPSCQFVWKRCTVSFFLFFSFLNLVL